MSQSSFKTKSLLSVERTLQRHPISYHSPCLTGPVSSGSLVYLCPQFLMCYPPSTPFLTLDSFLSLKHTPLIPNCSLFSHPFPFVFLLFSSSSFLPHLHRPPMVFSHSPNPSLLTVPSKVSSFLHSPFQASVSNLLPYSWLQPPWGLSLCT